MYEVFITKRASKDYKKLDDNVKNKILNELNKLKDYPFENTSKLRNDDIGEYRHRIGDYRIIFDIDESRIIILRIGHRKDIYR
jgi:mRNA interferase RelE/StbE